MIIMDEDDCMVDIARYFVDFLVGESCGKCLPCREGLRQMSSLLNDICNGTAEKGAISLLEELGQTLAETSLCALGRTAGNPVLTTIRYFRDEYEAHINKKKCPAGVCKALITYSIDAKKCNGCTLCARECPQHAIEGEKRKPHRINNNLCIRCGICREVCKQDAILVK